MTKSASSDENKVDFIGLILGFSSAALHYLGIAHEGDQAPEKNLVIAKQNIDILAMLKDKTKGNLSAEEAKLTEEVLADLQMKYVEAAKH